MNFKNLNLHPSLLSNIQTLGYESPTPIQEQSIPSILLGKDVMGLAQTGTGKTAAFALPILQRLMQGERERLRALILAPTRELAQQIHEAIEQLAVNTNLRSMTLYGGVSIHPQISNLKQGFEIAVACPGRLLDHIQQRHIDLRSIEVLVLDEADRMFDMGFLPDIRTILRFLPKQRQTLLFSATMPEAISHLANEVLQNPIKVEISRREPTALVKQYLFPVPHHLKIDLIHFILKKMDMDSVLIFTRTKHTAKKLAAKLEHSGFNAACLQGNLSQTQRQAAMNGFRDGTLQILVATDIASRGIDVSSISHVINYDIPETVETYIHRIGRTGRAAKEGEAYTLITDENNAEVNAIEKMLGRKIERTQFEDFDYTVTPPVRTLGKIASKKPEQKKKKVIA